MLLSKILGKTHFTGKLQKHSKTAAAGSILTEIRPDRFYHKLDIKCFHLNPRTLIWDDFERNGSHFHVFQKLQKNGVFKKFRYNAHIFFQLLPP